MTPEEIAAEIKTLMVERKIDPDSIVDHAYLSSYADGSIPLPITNISAMTRLASVLRCEPEYLWFLCRVAVPKSYTATVAARKRSATRGKRRNAAKPSRPSSKVCRGCNVEKPLSGFYKPSAGCCKQCAIAAAKESARRRRLAASVAAAEASAASTSASI